MHQQGICSLRNPREQPQLPQDKPQEHGGTHASDDETCTVWQHAFEETLTQEELACTVCLGPALPFTVIAPCGHVTCAECMKRLLEDDDDSAGSSRCPTCRGEIVMTAVVSAMADVVEQATEYRCLRIGCDFVGRTKEARSHACERALPADHLCQCNCNSNAPSTRSDVDFGEFTAELENLLHVFNRRHDLHETNLHHAPYFHQQQAFQPLPPHRALQNPFGFQNNAFRVPVQHHPPPQHHHFQHHHHLHHHQRLPLQQQHGAGQQPPAPWPRPVEAQQQQHPHHFAPHPARSAFPPGPRHQSMMVRVSGTLIPVEDLVRNPARDFLEANPRASRQWCVARGRAGHNPFTCTFAHALSETVQNQNVW